MEYVDIEKITSTNKQFWWPIYEVTENSYFEEIKLFPTIFKNQCRNNLDEPKNIHNKTKEAFL